MRKFWIGAAAFLAVTGFVAGEVQASTPNVKSNITVVDEKPAPKKKLVKVIKKPEVKKTEVKKDRRLVYARQCDSFFECLFRTKRATRTSFLSSRGGVSDRTTRSTVSFSDAKYTPGSIIVRTPERALYYVLPGGKALRYKVGVGKDGFQWSGNSKIGWKREWPDWSPTPNIKKRQPELPDHMKGGDGNPLGARALYLGATLYRIHGTNEPWKIGDAVSSGCIRLTNDDIIDLYNRAKIGATVVVQR